MAETGANEEDKKARWDRGPWIYEGRLRERIAKLRRIQLGQRGFLRPQIVQLFEQGPMNGVDIMNKLQEMSHGWYRPSPGSVYPILDQLEKEGIVARKDGKFELTAAYTERVGDDLTSALSAMESNTSYLEDIQTSDPKRLMRTGERIEKLAKRLERIRGSLAASG